MSRRPIRRRGFSLIELLLSVFILAIGIISVSALFPAGIAQQQATADDELGPVVAEQALGLLRSRVSPQDFGTFEEFTPINATAIARDPVPLNRTTARNGPATISGDWSCTRACSATMTPRRPRTAPTSAPTACWR